MTLKQVVTVTGEVPKKFITVHGSEIETVVEKSIYDESYLAIMWQIIDGKREHIFCFAHGNTSEIAKLNLKRKILRG